MSLATALLASLQTSGWTARTSTTGRASSDPFEKWLSSQLSVVARADLKARKLDGIEVNGVRYHKVTPEAVSAITAFRRSNLSDKKLQAFRQLFAATQATIIDLEGLED